MKPSRVPAALASAALLLSSPGLAPYQAAAQTVAAGASRAAVAPVVPIAPALAAPTVPLSAPSLNAGIALPAVGSLPSISVPSPRAQAAAPSAAPAQGMALSGSAVGRAVLGRAQEQKPVGLFNVLIRQARGVESTEQAAPESAFLKPAEKDMASDSGASGWAGNSFDVLAYGRETAGKVSSALSVPMARAAGWFSRGSLRPASSTRAQASPASVPAPRAAARPSLSERLRPYAKPALTAALVLGAALLLTGCSGVPGLSWLGAFSFKELFTLKTLAIQAGIGVAVMVVKKVLAKRAEKEKKAAEKQRTLDMIGPSRTLDAGDVAAFAAAEPGRQPRLMVFSYDTVGFQEVTGRDIGLFAPPAFTLFLDEKRNIVYAVPTFQQPAPEPAPSAPAEAAAAAPVEAAD